MASNSHSGIKSSSAAPGVGSTNASAPSSRNSSATKGQQQSSQSNSLAQRFPVNSLQELTLQSGEIISGRVYCTDEMTASIVLQTALVHTTLASEIRIVSSASVASSATLPETSASNTVAATPLSQPLPKIHKKTLEDRERRAIRLAEESLRHINQKATAVGQAVFDRLLKACGEVVWAPGDAASILVLGQIQVDPPYQPEHCKIISKPGANGRLKEGALADGSLDRVKKIVAAATASMSANAGIGSTT